MTQAEVDEIDVAIQVGNQTQSIEYQLTGA